MMWQCLGEGSIISPQDNTQRRAVCSVPRMTMMGSFARNKTLTVYFIDGRR